MNPYVLLLKVLAVIVMAGGLAYGVHKYNDSLREDGRSEIRAEYAKLLEKAHEDSRKAQEQFNQKIQEANNAANRRNKQIDAAHANAAAASDSLRDSLSHLRDSVPGATASALAGTITTLSTVLGDCGAKYQGMAVIGDRHSSDVQTLRDSWPTYDKIK